MNWLKQILKKIFPHKHDYCKPIASQYRSFNGRRVIYECSCGARKDFRVYKDFSDPFPIQTNINLSDKDFERILHAHDNLNNHE